MLSSSPSRLKPLNPTSPQPSEAKTPVASHPPPPPFSTFGLPEQWRNAYDWAVTQGVLSPLLTLIDAGVVHDKPLSIGSFLAEITTPTAQGRLKQWSESSAAAEVLSQLAVAVAANQEILNDYPPLTKGIAAAKQLHGELESHYLLGLVLERLPPGRAIDREWFADLRLWLLVHAIERAKIGNCLDNHLRTAASKLRLASNLSADWHRLFSELRTTTEDFDDFNRRINFHAGRMLTSIQLRQALTPTHRILLKSLQFVARKVHDQAKDLPTTKCTAALYPVPWDELQCHTIPPTPQDVLAVEGNESPLLAQPDEERDIVFVPVDGEQSYSHQRLAANSVLLATAEETQFLPWSWGKPNPFETKALNAWIPKYLQSSIDKERYLAAVVWIACATGRSLRRTLDLEISTTVSDEWALDLQGEALHRRPPIRYSGWRPQEKAAQEWVRPIVDAISISLPTPVLTAIQDCLHKRPKATALGDGWDPRWGESAEPTLRQAFKNDMERLTPAMLGAVLPQRAFLSQGNATLSRLLSSHPQSGLPGACAYGSWDAQTVGDVLSTIPLKTAHLVDLVDQTALGSRLYPEEALLKSAIRHAGRRVLALRRGNDVIAFHNAYTTYLVMALLAATGCRPVRDPFESPLAFDQSESLVFIEDKIGDALHQGRLLPLPRRLMQHLSREYCRHLDMLADMTALPHPRLSKEIKALSEWRPSEFMPFLFLLSQDEGLQWRSITPTEIEALGLFKWPLPPNLFRHRLDNRVREYGIDAEIIDALLGHAEMGGVTHGDYSLRCWQEDMDQARPALEYVFATLKFLPLKSWRRPPTVGPHTWASSDAELPTTHFGQRARKLARMARTRQAINDAQLQISAFLEGRQLAELSPEDINTLSRQLLFNDKGLPRTTGHLRYAYLMRHLERLWATEGKKVRIKQWYLRVAPEESIFSTRAIGAMAMYRQVRDVLQELFAHIQPSRLSFSDCAMLAVVKLCLEHRITALPILTAILEGRDFRLTQWKGFLHLEYAPGLEGDAQDPVWRRRISPGTATLLIRVLSCKRQSERRTSAIPEPLIPLAVLLNSGDGSPQSNHDHDVLTVLTELVNQVNAMTLPGVLAAWLSGRLPSASLSWRDWTRIEEVQHLQLPDQGNDEPTADPPTVTPAAVLAGQIDIEQAQSQARIFFRQLRREIKTVITSGTTRSTPTARRDLERRMRRLLEEWSGQVSSAVYLLGQWVTSLLWRRPRGQKYLALSSVDRYFSALSPAFEAIAYGADLLSFEGDEVTALYEQILEVRPHLGHQKYVALQLRDFHRWARGEGVEDPDWPELPLTVMSVAPGLILEREYQNTLTLLLEHNGLEVQDRQTAAFVMLCCYRFGMRSNEAMGLIRADWKSDDDHCWVLIRNNRYRTLKSRAARRQIPLLFVLPPQEQALIAQVLGNAEARHGTDETAPLLEGVTGKHGSPRRNMIKRVIIAILKQITGNPDITLHHGRHTYANCVGLHLFGVSERLWHTGAESLPYPIREDMEGLLMGTQGPSRRKSWALARLLGHAGQHTVFKNYLHFLSDWADIHIPPPQDRNLQIQKTHHLRNLDALPRTPAPSPCLNQLAFMATPPSPLLLLKFMRLLARGKEPATIATVLNLSRAPANDLLTLLENVDQRLRFPGRAKENSPLEKSYSFLRRIPEASWRRIIQHAATLDNRSIEPHRLSWPELIAMVGASRQVLAWEADHFSLLRSALDYWGIDGTQYHMLQSRKADTPILQLASARNFHPIKAESLLARKRELQLDSAHTAEDGFLVERRCAFVYIENDDKVFRNSIEWLIAFLAYATSTHKE